MSVVFVRSIHDDKRVDLWRLVALSGYETCSVDDVDPDRIAAYVLTSADGRINDCLLQHWRERRAMIVWWALDPDAVEHKWIADMVDETWMSDRWAATCNPRARYVGVGSHPELGADPGQPQYDFVRPDHVGTPRVDDVIASLEANGLVGADATRQERERILKHSRVLVHVHQSGPSMPSLRMALAAAYALPVVTEVMNDLHPLEDAVVQVPYGDMVDAVRRTVDDPGDYGQRIYNALCVERTFRSEIEGAF